MVNMVTEGTLTSSCAGWSAKVRCRYKLYEIWLQCAGEGVGLGPLFRELSISQLRLVIWLSNRLERFGPSKSMLRGVTVVEG